MQVKKPAQWQPGSFSFLKVSHLWEDSLLEQALLLMLWPFSAGAAMPATRRSREPREGPCLDSGDKGRCIGLVLPSTQLFSRVLAFLQFRMSLKRKE
jgi:hypothetical protein